MGVELVKHGLLLLLKCVQGIVSTVQAAFLGETRLAVNLLARVRSILVESYCYVLCTDPNAITQTEEAGVE